MDTQYNTKCYYFDKKEYSSGFLDKSVDATYVIHLENNGRLDHINEQLSKFQPTKTVYITRNQGFKKCTKKLIEQVSYQDLTDAFLQCFQHANKQGYDNILILEDDFIFSDEMKKSENIDSVNTFLTKKKEDTFVYYLGCNPIIIVPYDWNHYYSFESLSTHAMVYSRKTRQLSLNTELKHWDVIMKNSDTSKYLYYKPLCYQTYPETENKKTWSEKDNAFIFEAKKWIIQTLNLDKTPEPGFSIIYMLAKLLFLLFIFFILFTTFKLWFSYRYIIKDMLFSKYKNK
jgi:hypothetical protein